MLITLDEWLERIFAPGTVRPTKRTIYRLIGRRRLPATKIAGRYYVEEKTIFPADNR